MPAVPKRPKYDKKQDMENSRLALRLDNYQCQWHRFILGEVKMGSFPHHIYGRRRDWGLDAQITLCYDCHTDYHTARQENGETVITKPKLEKLMDEFVIPARKIQALHLAPKFDKFPLSIYNIGGANPDGI